MSRHKENNPLSLPSQTRVNGSVFGLSKPAPSSDFFTDSMLEDTSKIPSPSPHKQPVTKPRRALAANLNRPLKVSRDSANTAHPSQSPHNGKKSRSRHQHHPPLLSRPSLNSSQQDLITPPQSRDGPELKSPTSDVSSPPMALTDVYQRIADEERLAEREVEDDENDENEDMFMEDGRRSPSIPVKSSSQRPLYAQGSPPARTLADSDKENAVNEQTGSLSEASGISFLQGLTDPRIAVTMTPHFTERANDLRRLQNISNKPILFNQGPRPSEIAEDQLSSTSTERKASGPPLTRIHTAPPERVNGASGTTRSPQLQDFEDESTSDELLDAEKEVKNRKLRRLLTQTRAPTGSAPAPLDRRYDDEHATQDNNTRRSVQSEPSVILQEQPSSMPDKNPVPATAKGLLSMWSRKASEQKSQRQDSSQIDWAGLGADVPLPSVENSNEPQGLDSQSDVTGSVRSQRSIDRLRRLDNDFTGMSFQVSESPPVRSRKVEDYVRKQEIANLSKKALTTSQLNAIREKDPREAHRRLSRSPSGDQLRSKQSVDSIISTRGPESAGQQVPDTPVVVYRSSTGSSSQKSNHDRQSSHEQLQRLARAMSTTPKGSPVPAPAKEQKLAEAAGGDLTQAPIASSSNAPEVHQETSNKPSVMATPKVIGAWTDTILPDTVRTVRTSRMPSRYAQTPHVSAGGWVDTPMQNGYRQSSALAPMTIEEVTEEVTTDAALQSEVDAQQAETEARSPTQLKRTLPPSAFSRALEEEKFDMGETTLDSINGLLNETTTILDQRKFTLQKQASSEAAEMLDNDELGFIDHLGGKLQEVAVSLHDTRKGISHLEKAFMRASSAPVAVSDDVNPAQATTRNQNGLVPVLYSTITFPIPLLFHQNPQRSKSQTPTNPLTTYLPFGKPTPLGWLVIAIWSWYILESLAAELYSHPLQAEHYIWPPLDAPEPMFPYVLPTVLLRGVGLDASFGAASSTAGGASGGGSGGIFWTILGPVYLLIRALYRIIAIQLGLTDGFVDDFGTGTSMAGNVNARNAMASATAAVTKGVKSALASAVTSGVAAGVGRGGADVGGEEWNMMNDEFI